MSRIERSSWFLSECSSAEVKRIEAFERPLRALEVGSSSFSDTTVSCEVG